MRAAGVLLWLGAWFVAAVLVLHVQGISGSSRSLRTSGLLEAPEMGLRGHSRSLKLDEDEARFLGPLHERGSGAHESRHSKDDGSSCQCACTPGQMRHQTDVQVLLSFFLILDSADQHAKKPYHSMYEIALSC